MQGRPPPAEVYLDTSVLLAAVIQGAPHARACDDFCAELIAAGSYVHFSQLVRLELPQALRKLATRPTNLPAAVRTRHRLDDWGTDPAVREAWLQFGIGEFEALLVRFHEVFELPWSAATWRASIPIITQYSLQTIDATHVATAQEYGIQDFAAVDTDFRRVQGLTFWLVRDP
jgi:predicted nucleic acid-binding protein